MAGATGRETWNPLVPVIDADIGDAGAADLADKLRVNRTLLSLCLYRNRIGDGALAFEALRSRQPQVLLDLRGNNLGAAAVATLRNVSQNWLL